MMVVNHMFSVFMFILCVQCDMRIGVMLVVMMLWHAKKHQFYLVTQGSSMTDARVDSSVLFANVCKVK